MVMHTSGEQYSRDTRCKVYYKINLYGTCIICFRNRHRKVQLV
jgi:hypothetical protein